MRLWDLDGELLYPRQTVVAYVKNLLQLAGSRAQVCGLISSAAGFHWLDAVASDGRKTQLFAPFALGGSRRMFIPFVLQRALGNPSDYHWSADGRKTRGCMRIAAQPDGEEFWLVTSRSAVIRYAHSGKPPVALREAEKHPREVRGFIDRTLADPWIQENFRFADQDGRTRIVPFLPLVLNHGIATERRNGSPALPDYTNKVGPGSRR